MDAGRRPHPLQAYLDRRALVLLLLGFSAGLPLFLVFSSLSLWLSEAGVKRSDITLFSWAALAYSFKFVWAPLVDGLSVPYLTARLGRRRAWLLVAQGMIVLSVCLMALVNPQTAGAQLMMAGAAALLAFSSATQDVVIDAYRIEIGEDNIAMQPVMASTYIAGYRLGMIVSGAGALYLAEAFGSGKGQYLYGAWQKTYFLMAACMAACMAVTLCIREPAASARATAARANRDNLQLLLLFAAMVGAFILLMVFTKHLPAWLGAQQPLALFACETLRLALAFAAAACAAWAAVRSGLASGAAAREAWLEPVADFFRRYGKPAFLLLALIGLYRISDIVAGTVANLFYEHLGFSKTDIAAAVKTFGVIATILGGFVGGIFAQRYSLMKMMMAGAVLTASTNLLFSLMEWTGAYRLAVAGIPVTLYGVVGFDNLAAGFAGAVFVAFLSALTSIRFTAVQYAVFSSLMTLLPKLLGGYSGAMVDALNGYPRFFALTALLGVPVLILVWLNDRLVFRKDGK